MKFPTLNLSREHTLLIAAACFALAAYITQLELTDTRAELAYMKGIKAGEGLAFARQLAKPPCGCHGKAAPLVSAAVDAAKESH